MPFCPSCGRELEPGNKFCTECGAPLEGAPVPEPQSQPAPSVPPVPGPIQKRPAAFYIIIGIICVCAVITAVYFSGLVPATPVKSASGVTLAPTISVTPTSYVIISTPVNAQTPLPVASPTSSIVDSERYGSDYEMIYSLNRNFSYGQKITTEQSLTVPPLYIKFNLIPVNISRHRLVGIGTHQEHYENTTEISPNAWFEIKIFDLSDNHLVDQQGFGKDYSDITKQEFMIRKKGNYRLEFSGHEVYASVAVMKGISG